MPKRKRAELSSVEGFKPASQSDKDSEKDLEKLYKTPSGLDPQMWQEHVDQALERSRRKRDVPSDYERIIARTNQQWRDLTGLDDVDPSSIDDETANKVALFDDTEGYNEDDDKHESMNDINVEEELEDEDEDDGNDSMVDENADDNTNASPDEAQATLAENIAPHCAVQVHDSCRNDTNINDEHEAGI